MKAGTRPLALVSLCAMATALAATFFTRTVAAGTTNPSASLDQCANGPSNAPAHCSGSAWQNGNTNSNNSHWYEGDSIAYRARFSGLSAGTHYVTIQWDSTKNGKHALDYLTSYNRSESVGNDPCFGVPGCGSPNLYPIPPDTHTALNLDPAYPSPDDGRWNQVFTMFNGTITSVTVKDPSLSNPEVPYNLTGTYSSDSSTSITITFTAASATPVLAWGGHIGNRKDWGPNNSAVAITGSPYHMRILDVDGSGGNQDRSTSSSAVIFPAILTITKTVLAGNGTSLYGSTPFNFTTTSPSLNNALELPSGFTLVNDGGVNPQTALPDNQVQYKLYLFGTTSPQVTIAETATSGFVLTGLSCPTTLNGVPQASKTVDLASGTATIVANEGEYINCTYTNRQKYATLTVYKNVVTTNGGTAGAGAFTLHVRGNGQDLSAPGSSSGTAYSLPSGVYTVSEDPVSGYTQTGFSGNCGATGSITLGVSGSYTCTITNHDLPAHLTLVKNLVKKNGGSALPTDWTLSAAGPTPISGKTGDTTVTIAAVNAGAYALSEAGPSGYAASLYSCVKNGAAAVDGNSIQLANGDTATCTITNTDTTAHLTLVKHVTNNNGGTAQASDFTLSAAGPTPLTGAGTASKDVNAGTYTLSETGPSGYDAGAWSCSGGTFTTPNIIQLASGQSVTCDITNDDHTAHLKLVKVVNNANGGTAQAADFTLSASGPTPISGRGGADSNVNAGSYTLSETNVAGYTAGAWTCAGGTQNGTAVTLAPGQSATCTITNVAQRAHLKLVKVVNNDHGGTATPTDFILSAAGPTSISGSGGAESDVNAGSYLLSETGLAGYTSSGWTCVGGIQSGASVTLGPGQSAICSIINSDPKGTPTLATTMSWVLHDSLQISGLHAGAPNAGTIVFKLYGPSVTKICADVNDVANGVVNNLLYSETHTGVTGSGTFPTQAGFRVNDPGTYRWVVSYSGDDFNNPASTTCGDETHTITVGEPTPPTPPQ